MGIWETRWLLPSIWWHFHTSQLFPMVSSIESSKDVEIMLDLGCFTGRTCWIISDPDIRITAKNQSLSIPLASYHVLLTSILEIFPHNHDWTIQMFGRTCFIGVWSCARLARTIALEQQPQKQRWRQAHQHSGWVQRHVVVTESVTRATPQEWPESIEHRRKKHVRIVGCVA